MMRSSLHRPAVLVLAAVALLAACGETADSGSSTSASGRRAEGPSPSSSSEGGDAPAVQGEGNGILVSRAQEPFFGDLPKLRERRFVRVLVSYSKTGFFHEGGRPRGFEVEMVQAWEKRLNEGAGTYDRVRAVFIPVPFDRLLDELVAGRGDVVAAGLTVTPEREALAAFADPYIGQVSEVVVTHRGVGDLAGLPDLAGRRVVVRAGSSYAAHLRALNRKLGDESVEVVEADSRLVTEDLLEMANAGAIEITVADRHIAEAWAEVLPDIEIRPDLAVHAGGEIAWAVRRDSPELLADLNAFVRKNKKGSLMGNILLKRYFADSKWIANPVSKAERAKLEEHITLFQRYGEKFDFDWLALAAQAYQESGLDQSVKSAAGALGVMQLLPSTAADKSVQVADIHLLENNIHAGAKYLAFLRDRYFSDPEIEPAARVDFAWAAYNAGPARVRGLRAKAEERGLDPNRWFAHVEKIAAEEIGRETVDYVANINKYYLAYRLQYEAQQQRQAVRTGAADS
jgi:membrane-bound lytic murein transglycosylase MltF